MQEIARKRGGKCLSSKYMNTQTKLEWQCSKGHKWMATSASIKIKKTWCPKCNRYYMTKLTIEEMQEIARKRGGKCLSDKYINISTKLEWQCSNGHRWMSQPLTLKHGKSWCPKCYTSYHEEICRTTFEQLFKKKFNRVFPKWLVNKKTGGRLQLDGYCPSLKTAFEYNGSQHYKAGFFSQKKTSNSVENIRARDNLKIELCKKKRVFLFVINFKHNLIKLPKIIKEQSLKLGLNLSNIDFGKEINFDHVHQHNSKLIKMHKIARERGGKCLSNKYVNNITKLKWMCSKGHIWEAIPTHIVSDKSWCPVCAPGGGVRLTIEEMKKIARERGGRCLSDKYINGKTKLKWQCSNKHKWMARPSSIKYEKTWCPVCAPGGVRLTIEEMQTIARERGGKCLSDKYINSKTNLRWQCSNKHKWRARPTSIKYEKTWCPVCARINN